MLGVAAAGPRAGSDSGGDATKSGFDWSGVMSELGKVWTLLPVVGALGCGPGFVPGTEADAGTGGGDGLATSTGDDHDTGADGTLPPASTGGMADGTGTTARGTTGVATFGDDEGPVDDSSDGISFVISPDAGELCASVPPGYAASCCDLWQQDCPMGDKCVPFANDATGTWSGVRCTEVADDPAALGESCQVEGSAVSGIDDCEFGTLCMFVDVQTSVGTCVAMCGGTQIDPICPEQTSCFVTGDGVLNLCLSACDPFAGPCGTAAACVPSEEGFVCMPHVPEPVGDGVGCNYAEDCAPGLACVDGELTSCDDERCCTTLCDLSVPDPNSQCPGAGLVCQPVYADPVPPGYESAGLCVTGA